MPVAPAIDYRWNIALHFMAIVVRLLLIIYYRVAWSHCHRVEVEVLDASDNLMKLIDDAIDLEVARGKTAHSRGIQ